MLLVFIINKNFIHVVPIRSKKKVPNALEFRDLEVIVTDTIREVISKEFELKNKIGIILKILKVGML